MNAEPQALVVIETHNQSRRRRRVLQEPSPFRFATDKNYNHSTMDPSP